MKDRTGKEKEEEEIMIYIFLNLDNMLSDATHQHEVQVHWSL